MPPFRTALFLLLLAACLASPGCELDSPKSGSGRAAVAGCNPDTIKFYAARYSASLVFDACGINNFRFFRWSPDGNRLFFQTGGGPFVLDGQTRNIEVLPIPAPSSTPLWLDDNTIAYPHLPKDKDTHQINFYNLRTRVLSPQEIEQKNPRLLQAALSVGVFYFVADTPKHKGRVFRFNTEDGKVDPAFEWIQGELTAFAFHPKKNLVSYKTTSGGEVILATAKGKRIRAFPSAERATFSTDAQWLLIEETGGRKRLESAKGSSAGNKPPAFVPDIPPRRVYLWNLEKSTRVELPGLWGNQAEWYPDHAFFSLILQGFDEHYYNPNVLLVDVNNLILNQKLRDSK